MRSRTLLLISVFAVGSLALPFAAHAAIPFFGPIIPPAINYCPASWGMVMDVINRIISFLITIAILFIAPVMIAYAGFLYVVNSVNPEGIGRAKSILKNTIVGIVVALAAWLIVGAVMAVLYHPDPRSGFVQNWAGIISSGGMDPCLIQEGALQQLNQTNFSVTGVSASGNVVNVSGKTAPLCSNANLGCSPAALQKAGFTPAQANVMSCIAATENGGNPTGCNGNACGTFQILLTRNQLVGPACALYNNGNATLNCPNLCKAASGNAVRNEPSCQPCVEAANNSQCNAQAARNLYVQSGYAPWTTFSDNKKSAACIQQYAGG